MSARPLPLESAVRIEPERLARYDVHALLRYDEE